MILLGAGSSVPFGIPAMKRFTEQFREKIEDQHNFIILFTEIETALKKSNSLVGHSIDFDLESLMVVLEDLASNTDRPISSPTFSFMLNALLSAETKGYNPNLFNVTNLRAAFGKTANDMLNNLRCFIFDNCIEPIKRGQQSANSFDYLDQFYGPLFSLIEPNINNSNGPHIWIFTTNWDLCLKQWLEYREIAFEDGTCQSNNKKTVLNPSVGWLQNSGNIDVKVVPLHGSFDLQNCKRFASGKQFSEIQKITSPDVFFSGKPSEISKAFIIYPLEAVGYAETIKSPYLDMLVRLKNRLREENIIYVIGFSFRDSIIASIFDEVVREKLEKGRGTDMKVLLLDSSPDVIVKNLNEQGYVNLANTIIPVKCTYPKVLDYEQDKEKIQSTMQTMIEAIAQMMRLKEIVFDMYTVNQRLEKYHLHLSEKQFS